VTCIFTTPRLGDQCVVIRHHPRQLPFVIKRYLGDDPSFFEIVGQQKLSLARSHVGSIFFAPIFQRSPNSPLTLIAGETPTAWTQKGLNFSQFSVREAMRWVAAGARHT
jgi:hypothetical protein